MKKIGLIFIATLLISMSTVREVPRFFIIGDSTASIYSSSLYPRTGWAQVLQGFLSNDSVQVIDSALSGRSSKSFYDEGHWTPIKNMLRSGDFVLIQFGHNDEKTDDVARGTIPGTTFKQYLNRYIDDAINKGAVPILATPIERNSWSGTTIKSTHITSDGDYPAAIREVASAKNIKCIDATNLTKTLFEKIGKDSTNKFFMNLSVGEWPNYPSGNSDNTHLQERGAKAVAQLIVNDIDRQNIKPLAVWIKNRATSSVKGKYEHSPPKPHLTVQVQSKGTPYLFDLCGRFIRSENLNNDRSWNGVYLRREHSGLDARFYKIK